MHPAIPGPKAGILPVTPQRRTFGISLVNEKDYESSYQYHPRFYLMSFHFLRDKSLNKYKYPQLVSNTRSGRGMRYDEAPIL